MGNVLRVAKTRQNIQLWSSFPPSPVSSIDFPSQIIIRDGTTNVLITCRTDTIRKYNGSYFGGLSSSLSSKKWVVFGQNWEMIADNFNYFYINTLIESNTIVYGDLSMSIIDYQKTTTDSQANEKVLVWERI